MKKPASKNFRNILILLFFIFVLIGGCIMIATYMQLPVRQPGFIGALNDFGAKLAFIINTSLYCFINVQGIKYLFGKASLSWGIIFSLFLIAPYGRLAIIPIAIYWFLVSKKIK